MEFRLPDIGEGIAEGEIVKWKVKEGETVREDQPLVEVMTDKATVEIPSPASGVVEKICVAEGQIAKVGQVLVVIREEGKAAAKSPTGAQAVVTAPLGQVLTAPAGRVVTAPAGRVVTAPAGRVLAAPAVRRRAQEMGIDLGQVPASGPGGRVTGEDLERFASGSGSFGTAPAARAATAAPGRVVTAPAGREERIPLRGLRRRIAEHMVQAKRTAPHFTLVDEVDMTELVTLKNQSKDWAEHKGVRLTYLPFILKAVVKGLEQHPMLNAVLDEKAGEIVLKKYYNIGIATDTSEGLIVPVVRDVDKKDLVTVAKEVEAVVERARTGKASLEDLQGSTFTITSMGPLGGVLATPILNYPEVAILGVHRITRKPVVRDDQIVIREIGNLSVSLDHRVVDGAVAARFLATVTRFLEDPKLLLEETLG